MLSIDAMLDLCLGVSAIVAQPVGLTGEGFIVAEMNGFFAGQSPLFDSLAKSAEANILITIVTVAYSAAAFMVIMGFCQVRDEFQPMGLHVLDLNNWLNRKNGYVLGGHIKEWKVIAHVTLWTTTSCASTCIVIWCEKRINKIFKPLGHMSHGNAQSILWLSTYSSTAYSSTTYSSTGLFINRSIHQPVYSSNGLFINH
ncbi:hypothetical protein DdX_18358 [Ditylenchus destructor]|uniref:Uncharacterized protein n=1 Tax=Ditylenchus destructor TaxID=166010 RepID=A0AAD4QSW7_9BILA|nr:hypothetical protein DdX_18358 [Ditylenchus destructor]